MNHCHAIKTATIPTRKRNSHSQRAKSDTVKPPIERVRLNRLAQTVFLRTEPIEQVEEVGVAAQLLQEVISFEIRDAGKSVDGSPAQPFDGGIVFAEQRVCDTYVVRDVMRVGERGPARQSDLHL